MSSEEDKGQIGQAAPVTQFVEPRSVVPDARKFGAAGTGASRRWGPVGDITGKRYATRIALQAGARLALPGAVGAGVFGSAEQLLTHTVQPNVGLLIAALAAIALTNGAERFLVHHSNTKARADHYQSVAHQSHIRATKAFEAGRQLGAEQTRDALNVGNRFRNAVNALRGPRN